MNTNTWQFSSETKKLEALKIWSGGNTHFWNNEETMKKVAQSEQWKYKSY